MRVRPAELRHTQSGRSSAPSAQGGAAGRPSAGRSARLAAHPFRCCGTAPGSGSTGQATCRVIPALRGHTTHRPCRSGPRQPPLPAPPGTCRALHFCSMAWLSNATSQSTHRCWMDLQYAPGCSCDSGVLVTNCSPAGGAHVRAGMRHCRQAAVIAGNRRPSGARGGLEAARQANAGKVQKRRRRRRQRRTSRSRRVSRRTASGSMTWHWLMTRTCAVCAARMAAAWVDPGACPHRAPALPAPAPAVTTRFC